MTMAKSKPLGLEWRSSSFFIVGTVGVGLFTDLFLYGLVVPILPFVLQDRVHIDPDQIQSNASGLLAAYAGASVIFSPLAGVIADRTSTRQMPFLVGLAALLVATLLFFLGQTIAVLALARVLQGISAAVVWTVGLALVLDTVGPDNLGKTIGSIFGFISIGELASPVLGGILYKKTGDRGVFALASGLLLIDFVMRLLLIERKSAAAYEAEGEDRNGHDSQTSDEEEETDPSEEDALLGQKEDDEQYKVAPNQRRWVRAFPVVYCLKNPRLLTSFLLTIVQATLLAAFDATIPTVALDFYHFDSLKAGFLFIALIVPYLILGPVAGWAVDRYGPKPASIIGYGYLFPVLILLRLAHRGGTSRIIQYCVLLALCGLGLGVIGSPALVEASYIVRRYHKMNPDFFGAQGPYAQLYGLNSMIFSAGLTLGPLVSGSLKDAIGYGNMNLVIAVLCLITAVLSFVYIGGKPRLLRRKE